jgi:hypothetical protein
VSSQENTSDRAGRRKMKREEERKKEQLFYWCLASFTAKIVIIEGTVKCGAVLRRL